MSDSIEKTITKLVYLFRFVNDTGIVPQNLFARRSGSTAGDILQKNRNIVMLILMTNFIHKMARKCYELQEVKIMNGKFEHAPQTRWGNDYPIVLVHGYVGGGPDSSWLIGNYFGYAVSKNVVGHNKDVYVAVMSPIAGIHDRACELYQQLVGITAIRKRAGLKKGDTGPNLARAVYGSKHFMDEHPHQKMYKPRLLRQIRGKEVLAFPDGIPGGWSDLRKIHFIGHSLGAQTCRYLQHLLSIDYFGQIEKFDTMKYSKLLSFPTSLSAP